MNKTVFITGGAGGIGSALSLEFAKNGYTVALNHNTTDPSAVMEEIKKYSPLSRAYCGDMSDYEAAKRLIGLAESEIGDIDCLINNAGVSYVGLFNTMRPEDWKKVFAANVDTVFNCSHAVLQSMLRRREGCIINISSMWGEAGASCEVAYSATKGAVDSFTRALSKEAAPNGIRVNAIACGYIETRMNSHLTEEEKQAFFEEIPLMRAGTPTEIAKAALFLAGDDAAYITGEILRVNGGLL